MPLKRTEKFGYATGDFACCLVWQTLSLYLLYYCTNVVGIDSVAAVSMISISQILDGCTDVLMGFLIDRTRSRFGRVRPYILTMGLPLAVSTALLFSVPAGLSADGKLVWIFIFYNLSTTVFYTALNVPYSSMHCFLTDESTERSRLSILRLVFAFAAQVLVNASVFPLVRLLGNGELLSRAGWTRTVVILGACTFGLTLVTFFTTRERVTGGTGEKGVRTSSSLRSIFRNPYLLLLLASTFCVYSTGSMVGGSSAYYAQFVLRRVDAVSLITNAVTGAQVFSLVFISPILIRHFGKRQIFLAGSSLLVLAYLCGTLRPDSLALVLAVNVVKGLANGATGPMVYAICADAVDYGEWKDGFSSAGLSTAMVQCVGKLGMAVGTAVLGGILSSGGFAATAPEQTTGGQQALISVYTWVPALFILCSGVIMFFNRLDCRYPEIIADLRKRREQQQKGKQAY